MPKITPFLWFDTQAEEAARFYAGIFRNSKINRVARYNAAGPGAPGSVMTVDFELDGQAFVALNGGPQFPFTEAVSFSVECEDQAEIDYFWTALSQGGQTNVCGWLKDRYGLSWQIVPRELPELVGAADHERAQRAMKAMLGMTKLDIGALEAAAAG